MLNAAALAVWSVGALLIVAACEPGWSSRIQDDSLAIGTATAFQSGPDQAARDAKAEEERCRRSDDVSARRSALAETTGAAGCFTSSAKPVAASPLSSASLQ